jgi:Ca-activated chloride channel homolog
MSEKRPVTGQTSHEDQPVTLTIRPERRLIPHSASERHVDFHLAVAPKPKEANAERAPLTLALVLDRSGSMSGDKIQTAKRAALAVIDKLDERDTVGVVVYDDQIEVIQAPTALTNAVKLRIKSALAEIDARSMTALHEGWLTGCDALEKHAAATGRQGLTRLFLLTDGLANVGLTDPEQIASQAAGIRRNAGIGTSTFGIGEDYAEELLGPMAVGGGGQFHNLRTSAEIATAFAGELGELLLSAVANVRLEVEIEPGAALEVVSMYPAVADTANPRRWSVMVGDLMSGEERHLLIKLSFPTSARREGQSVRARLVWTAEGEELASDWRALQFTYATDAECEAEAPDVAVVHLVGEALSDHAQRQALVMSKRGDLAGAQVLLRETSAGLAMSMPLDPSLATEVEEINRLAEAIQEEALPSASSKEAYFRKQSRSRGQRDLRQ